MAFAQAEDSLLLYGYQPGVVKSGAMYYKPARICLQPTGCVKKYWCEFQRESSNHPRELVLAEMPTDIHQDVETISLETVFKITKKEGLIKEKSIFQIMTSNGKYTLGTDSLEKTEGWIRVLNEEIFGPPKHDVVYEYRVKVQKTYSEDIHYGSYLLEVYNNEIKLYTSNGLIPTKFKCFINDIHNVKYHAFGPLKSCVTISIKNAQTNNKATDVVILKANSALEIERVINHRKKILLSEGKLGGKIATQNRDSPVPINLLQECLDELKQNLEGINITSTSNEEIDTLSNRSLRRQKKIQDDDAFVLNSDAIDDDATTFTLLKSSKEEPIQSQTLPRIYRATTDPSIDDHNGEVWSESFELRAPKRKQGVRRKKRLPIPPHRTIRNRPPAALPRDAENSFEDQNDEIAMDSNTSSPTDSRSSMEYAYVKRNTIPRLIDANAVLTQFGETYRDDYDVDYVINSISHDQTYLCVLHS